MFIVFNGHQGQRRFLSTFFGFFKNSHFGPFSGDLLQVKPRKDLRPQKESLKFFEKMC